MGFFFLSFRLDGSGQITVIPAELRGFWEMDGLDLDWMDVILPETSSQSPENTLGPKRKQSYSNHPCSGASC